MKNQLAVIDKDTAARKRLAEIDARIDADKVAQEHVAREWMLMFAEVWENKLWQFEMIPADTGTNDRPASGEMRPCESFDEWVEIRHELSRSRGYQLKDAGLVCRGLPVVENERQARKIVQARRDEQKALTPEETINRSRKAGEEVARKYGAAQEIASLEKAVKYNEKVAECLENMDAPEKVYKAIMTIGSYCREQLEWARKAKAA